MWSPLVTLVLMGTRESLVLMGTTTLVCHSMGIVLDKLSPRSHDSHVLTLVDDGGFCLSTLIKVSWGGLWYDKSFIGPTVGKFTCEFEHAIRIRSPSFGGFSYNEEETLRQTQNSLAGLYKSSGLGFSPGPLAKLYTNKVQQFVYRQYNKCVFTYKYSF